MGLENKSKKDEALEFVNGIRGQYIISQALYYSSKMLKNTEPSNAYDMEYMMENCFSIFSCTKNMHTIKDVVSKLSPQQKTSIIDQIISESRKENFKYNRKKDNIYDLLQEAASYLFKQKEIFTYRSEIVSCMLDDIGTIKMSLEESKNE